MVIQNEEPKYYLEKNSSKQLISKSDLKSNLMKEFEDKVEKYCNFLEKRKLPFNKRTWDHFSNNIVGGMN